MKRLAVLVALACCGAGSAAVSPHVQERIVPGHSIGKVRLGMTLEQVKKVLGRPESTIEARDLGFGKAFLELGWNFGEWRVGFVRSGGRYSVVRVATSVRSERTREGIGPGVLGTRVERAYGVKCLFAFFKAAGNRFANYWCVVGHRGGARTAYVVWAACKRPRVYGNCPGEYPENSRLEVAEVWVFAPGAELPVNLTNDRLP